MSFCFAKTPGLGALLVSRALCPGSDPEGRYTETSQACEFQEYSLLSFPGVIKGSLCGSGGISWLWRWWDTSYITFLIPLYIKRNSISGILSYSYLCPHFFWGLKGCQRHQNRPAGQKFLSASFVSPLLCSPLPACHLAVDLSHLWNTIPP